MHVYYACKYNYAVITCESLPAITNGSIAYATIPIPNYIFGTTATYTCVEGFGLKAGNRNRVCTGERTSPSGAWSGATPRCEGTYLENRNLLL